MRITFLGGAGTVTGSKYLVEAGKTKLLVDCGLFQGLKPLRLRNWEPLGVAIPKLAGVLLTHAHIDHSGYLPLLVREGYAGPIYCTQPTRDLANILLPDSGHLQEEDAKFAAKKRFSKHKTPRPLYTEEDARQALPQLEPRDYDQPIQIGDITARLISAGHILGSASVVLSDGDDSVVFSGDLGRYDDPVMHAPAAPGGVKWVVMESTYGDRLHPDTDPVDELMPILRSTLERRGVLLIPAFAVGRTQKLLYCLSEAFNRDGGLRVPVYVNSPMATSATRLYNEHADYHRLSESHSRAVCGIAKFISSVQESKALNSQQGPAVILSASGMATGGRVLHHLKALAPNHRNTILLAGFQAAGTRGASLANGARAVKIHGEYVAVRAQVAQLHSLSAHADQAGLLKWLGAVSDKPRGVMLVHGEGASADELRRQVKDTYGHPVRVVEDRERVDLAVDRWR